MCSSDLDAVGPHSETDGNPMMSNLMMSSAINHLSTLLMVIGLGFWFWGTWPLLGQRSILFKLHSLSVSDTLGSMAMIVGLLLQIPREWPLLVLALISLAIWNTVLGYVLAYCSSSDTNGGNHGSY
mgnify:CR=1 FL=1